MSDYDFIEKEEIYIMKISTAIGAIARHVGHERAIEYVAKAGFDAYDLSLTEMVNDLDYTVLLAKDSPFCKKDYIKFVRRLNQVAKDNGIVCNQSHAPFPCNSDVVRSLLKRSIEITAEAGGEICVIHPDNYKTAEENSEMYFELLPFAKECGVKIATENMWLWNLDEGHAAPAACSHHNDFLRHIEVINDEYFVACLDIGHAEMKGLDTSAVDMIKTLGHHIQALHLHDNDLLYDYHSLPGTMDIDYKAVVKALKEIGYNGYFTLEAGPHIKDHTAENVFEGVKEMAESAKALADMFDMI